MENLQHQFNRYFVDNGATEWWLTGLKTTLLVTVIALCIGVVLGLLIALIRSTHEQTGKLKLLNIVARVYLTIIRGTPSMIQILFFYSVIFATVNLNNIVIGGIAFGINSGAYVADSSPALWPSRSTARPTLPRSSVPESCLWIKDRRKRDEALV